MIKIQDVNNNRIPHETLKFPGGELHVRIKDSDTILSPIRLTAYVRNSDDVMELLLVTDAINRHWPGVSIELILPYLPYARQDRVAVAGEALSLKVFTNLINAQKYAMVTVWDCHSDVGLALLDNVYNVDQATLIQEAEENMGFELRETVFIAPDAGARKKIYKTAEKLGVDKVICADKHRDVVTGKITKTEVKVPEEYLGKGYSFVVLDDICDGGRTFIELGKLLREQMPKEELSLVVTHGIFSNEENLKTLKSLYNNIVSFNDFNKEWK